MHQATVRGFDIREAVFAWIDACNRKPKAELLQRRCRVHPFADLYRFGSFCMADLTIADFELADATR